jgi:hypothetical protein
MNKHTLGPWEFRKENPWTIFADGDSIMGNRDYYPWVPTKEADWLLIAAAPDLLEALEYMVNTCPAIDPSGEDAHTHARYAIAKATGETQ